jgi:ABC-2 type transport system ATP-binding protein
VENFAIRVHNLSMIFGREQVLNHITHDFEQGKIHGIVGNNGSGKSVFFKCVCGLLRPTEGEIYVADKRIGKDVDFPESLGMIIESPGFLPYMSGYKNLKLLAALKGKISGKKIKEVISQVGLSDSMRKHTGKYSMGMRQRLGIAQAIMEDPDYLILDEPFNGLDKQGVADMHGLIKGLREKGKTILLASHNAVDIEMLCDTVCEMDAGVLSVIR